MSYTAINGMRSARYPLQGLGACSCNAMMGTGVGDTPSPSEMMTYLTVGAVAIGVGTLGVFFLTRGLARNPRRRRRRRRAN